eukprot:TRINITY_DN18709_c0_g1_i1.p1 TRINITY_DN18709_c0_g1~~TRINITY_DN18709_c0_g1_i1.p1  ORF type:complete len:305 (+),score=57.31 TRINITY_DN18709_c0_g1_i1:219-1133(+)
MGADDALMEEQGQGLLRSPSPLDKPPECYAFPMFQGDCDEHVEPAPIPRSAYQDLPWAVAFLANTALLIGLLAWLGRKPDMSSEANFNVYVLFAIGLSAGCALLLSALYLFLIFTYARQAIWFSIWANAALLTALGLVSFGCGYVYTGIVACLVVPLYLFWINSIQNRIQLATEMISICISVLRKFPAIHGVTAGFLVLSFGFVLAWSWTAYSLFDQLNYHPGHKWTVAGWLFFSLMWGLYVLQYVHHLTIAGTVSSWYFDPTEPGSPIRQALQRSSTQLFGTACFGGLVIATLETLEAVARCC